MPTWTSDQQVPYESVKLPPEHEWVDVGGYRSLLPGYVEGWMDEEENIHMVEWGKHLIGDTQEGVSDTVARLMALDKQRFRDRKPDWYEELLEGVRKVIREELANRS